MATKTKKTAPVELPPMVATTWDMFRQIAIHPDAPPKQLIAMRRAYYAGANALMIMMSEPSLDEHTFRHLARSIQDELERFGAQVRAGVA